MIHHLSIPVENPGHVAQVLCELFGGKVSKFGPYENAYIAWAGDEHGTAIEVFPVPGAPVITILLLLKKPKF